MLTQDWLLPRPPGEVTRSSESRNGRELSSHPNIAAVGSVASDSVIDLWAPVSFRTRTRCGPPCFRGLTNQEIAERLGLSPHTIARHLANARAKLGAANRAEAAAKFEEMKV